MLESSGTRICLYADIMLEDVIGIVEKLGFQQFMEPVKYCLKTMTRLPLVSYENRPLKKLYFHGQAVPVLSYITKKQFCSPN